MHDPEFLNLNTHFFLPILRLYGLKWTFKLADGGGGGVGKARGGVHRTTWLRTGATGMPFPPLPFSLPLSFPISLLSSPLSPFPFSLFPLPLSPSFSLFPLFSLIFLSFLLPSLSLVSFLPPILSPCPFPPLLPFLRYFGHQGALYYVFLASDPLKTSREYAV